ncbi:putrescine transport system ATP-binding protein [Rubricella aquisinus]|uniref:Spermidine/putrescine import ATP-binding protein PotA n=1 Tax=Rubricella aquisinus TaxID=2028108 RepID=A0A840WXU4_9RHOB|nr:putrescine transport system ATP-binding protein [Rubricella aquisinus]
MTAPIIRLRNVVKTFGDFTAVDDLSLDIDAGELFCLLGGSGSGKSTLLRMLAGFESPDSGTIEIDGKDMRGVDPADRPVNMMFQSYALFPHMTVAENVGYGLRRMGLAKAEVATQVAEMLRLVKLEALAQRKPHQLSGGQRQRVALARALARKPKVLLLDEPLSALDKKLREDTQFELMNIFDATGTTFIVVTHDQEEAMVLATRIAVMDAGKFVQVDTPRQLYEFPKTRFVADFIGNINLLEATVTGPGRSEGLAALHCEALGAVEAACDGEVPPAGAHVWLAVRPEKIALSTDTAAPGYDAVVDDLGYRGGDTQYRLRTASGAALKVTKPNTERQGQRPVDWDTPVRIAFAPEAALVLRQ